MRDDIVDVLAIGAGIAGLSAAIRAAGEGSRTVLVERAPVIGGFVRDLQRVPCAPGLPVGLSGSELVERAGAKAMAFGVEIRLGTEVTRIQPGGTVSLAELGPAGSLRARSLVIATGAAGAIPAIPGVREFSGAGVYFDAEEAAGSLIAGADAFITGPIEPIADALPALVGVCRSVTVLAAREPILGRVPTVARPALATAAGLHFRAGYEILGAHGVDSLEAIELRCRKNGKVVVRPASVLILLPTSGADTAWLPEPIERTIDGSVLVGTEIRTAFEGSRWPLRRAPFSLETTVPGIFAAGQARYGFVPSIGSAVIDGVNAARQAHHFVSYPARSTASRGDLYRSNTSGEGELR